MTLPLFYFKTELIKAHFSLMREIKVHMLLSEVWLVDEKNPTKLFGIVCSADNGFGHWIWLDNAWPGLSLIFYNSINNLYKGHCKWGIFVVFRVQWRKLAMKLWLLFCSSALSAVFVSGSSFSHVSAIYQSGFVCPSFHFWSETYALPHDSPVLLHLLSTKYEYS